jgi:myo-inositol-1(or 4)-monophosphatase
MAEEKMKAIALKAVKEAGKILMDGLGRIHEINYKHEIDLVTEIDRLSEERIITIIKEKYPDHEILAEEGGKRKGSSIYRWIIDPLDGTTNYAHGYPCFCISIALEENGEVIYGVVYDPTRKEFFIGEKGKGATLNDKPIFVSHTEMLDHSLLCTGFPYDIREGKETNLDHFQRFSMKSQAVRRDGAAALDLCYVASGRFDGYWELKLSPWDVAAGSLMVKEAGGMVTDFEGKKFNLTSSKILASNGRIHREMVEVLRSM